MSVGPMSDALRRERRRLELLPWHRWRRPAPRKRILPVPVILNRLLADFLVLIPLGLRIGVLSLDTFAVAHFQNSRCPVERRLGQAGGNGSGNSGAASRAGTLFVWPGFAYGESAGSNRLAVERLNGGASAVRRDHGDEAETARLMADAFDGDINLGDVA